MRFHFPKQQLKIHYDDDEFGSLSATHINHSFIITISEQTG